MDVSSAADLLFEGVVPERVTEMQGYWKTADPDRVRLLEAPRFLVQASYGSIQVSEKALRLYLVDRLLRVGRCGGLLGSNQRAARCWRTFRSHALDGDPHQQALDSQFDALFAKIREMEAADSIEDVDWPQAIPKPIDGLKISDPAKKATFDLICMAGGGMSPRPRHSASRPSLPSALGAAMRKSGHDRKSGGFAEYCWTNPDCLGS